MTPLSRIGPYEVLALLGAGGMGEVYRARDTRLDREVALKVLPPSFALDGERVARFTHEAKTLAALSHPHIAQIYGLEDAGESPALVMELVPGESLAARLQRGTPPLREALDLARQIADGLAAAHERGIIHRDVKPANIQVTPDGVVKILDFGLAKVLPGPAGLDKSAPLPATQVTQMTAPGIVVGTPAYMSPEQVRGHPVDRRADVWAFGCVLFELLGGRRAFGGATAPDSVAAVLEREPAWERLPATTPTAVRALAHRCLRKDPKQRLHDTADAMFILEDALATLAGAADVGAAIRSSPADVRHTLAPGGEALQTEPPTRVGRAQSALLRGVTLKVGLLAVVALVALWMVYDRERQRSQDLTRLAAETFFQTRELDADLARLRRSGTSSDILARSSYRLTKLEQSYDRYLDLIGTYAGKTPTERSVMRMARRLGESELDVPPGFHALAMQHVEEWRADAPRLQAALDRARHGNLLELVYKALEERGLPRELALIPLQESHFDIASVGPLSRYGISKGMWGFIPETATRYGLALGPLHNTPVYDALDERHDAVRSTDAAVRHLADLYSSPAAASGLLVIAAYTYGPVKVIQKLNELPDDPRDRNFWNFYRHKWLSDEALDYVMSVFAAALVCENPGQFDVPIDRP